MPHARHGYLLGLILATATFPALALDVTPPAENRERAERRAALCPPPPPPALLSIDPPAERGSLEAVADRATRDGSLLTLEGNTEIVQAYRSAGGDFARIDRSTETAELRGDVFLTTEELLLEAEHGRLQLDSGIFEFDAARFHERSVNAQGESRRITRDAEAVTRLERTTFSTCPRFREDWYLSAGSINLDQDARQGTARDVSLHFYGVPLFYTPYLRFPLGEDRLTGFLPPRIGRSTNSGIEIATPWYWNAAPNFDATLTPTYLQRRGGQLRSQWRWLNRQGFWQLDHEYLPNDRIFGDDRELTQIQHEGRLGRRWRTELDASAASDPTYFDDLGDDLDLTSRTHLLRRGDLEWRSGRTRFRARAQSYQTLDESIPGQNRPYQQLPQLQLTTDDQQAGPLRLDLESEGVRWERTESTTGTRARIVPAVRAPIERPGWFVRPRLALDHTSYRLDRIEADPGRESIDRTLPVSSLDSGLRFERPVGGFRQTLEPRLFYVHIPTEDQDDIPLFDTGEFDFSFSQLFRERRFAGGDRIGDSNRLTLALTSRLLDTSDGREVLRGSIGGIRHFADREVRLDAGAPEERSTSDIVGEVAFSPTRHWRAETTVQWDPELEETRRVATRLGYRGDRGGIGNLGWRSRRAETGDIVQNQIDASFVWPVNPRWSLLGRINHSLEAERNLETLGGVEYRSCCWSIRGVAREYVTDRGEDTATSVSIELVLRGLGGVGDDAGGIFERAILGYRDPHD
jgi:LPS-assembly protein